MPGFRHHTEIVPTQTHIEGQIPLHPVVVLEVKAVIVLMGDALGVASELAASVIGRARKEGIERGEFQLAAESQVIDLINCGTTKLIANLDVVLARVVGEGCEVLPVRVKAL